MNNYGFLNGLESYLEQKNHPRAEVCSTIKKAVLHGNPYAIRDLILSEISRGKTPHTEQLVKAILSNLLKDEDDVNARRVLSLLSHCVEDPYIQNAARWSIKCHNVIDFDDHFSRGQMNSKIWLVEELRKVLDQRHQEGYTGKNVVQYGGWYATVAYFILQDPRINQYISLDTDPECVEIADWFNESNYKDEWRFKAAVKDVNEISWEGRTFNVSIENRKKENIDMRVGPNLIINTSCEHMTEDWFYNLPKDMFVCLQTNNYFSRQEHINCVNSIDEALEKYQFSHVFYSGERDMESYTRFMIIGTKHGR